MPQYQYAARDERGNAVTGTLSAASPEALADQLKRMGYLVTRARETAEGGGGGGGDPLALLRRVGAHELVLFNVQLSKMIQVGIPLVTALDTLTRQTAHPVLRSALEQVARGIERGASFSEALQRHPRVFSPLFISMVRAGEASGRLDEILRRLASFAKRQAELREQLATALTYPLILLAAGIAAAGFLVTGIVPKFLAIFLEARMPLPLPTLLLHRLSLLLRHHGLALLAAAAGLGCGLRWAVRTPAGRQAWDRFVLRVPVAGDLARKAAIARMARTLQTLLGSGLPVLESLEIAEATCGNTVIAAACRAAHTSVARGGTLADPLRVSGEFPPMVVQMLAVGEASGTVDHMLEEIADHYDDLVRYQLKRLTAFVEPVFLLLMGGFVAFIMASILLPLFRMVHVVR